MSIEIFSQSRALIYRREFSLLETGVESKERTLLASRKFHVPYEGIPENSFEVSVYSKTAFWLFIACVLLGITLIIVGLGRNEADKGIFYLLLAIPFGVRLLFSRITYIGYDCGEQQLLFFKDNPSRDDLNNFLAKMQNLKQQFLRTNYLDSPSTTLADELQKLTWLKEHGALTDEEFEKIKNNILSKEEKPNKGIGFLN